MGNYKFRLSEIIPNAWFYKLKEMGNKTSRITSISPSKKKHQNQTTSSGKLASTAITHRKSYYFTRDLTITPPETPPEPPRKSSRKRRSTRTNRASEPESASCGCSNEIDGNQMDTVLQIQLPPIVTKTSAETEQSEEQRSRTVRRHPGLKLRTNSPKIGCRKRIEERKSVSSRNFVVVKTSEDPRRDFRESMVEMIVENNIRGSKDLEDLLACYLSLNSDEYHDLIIKVFKQIWFDVFMNVRLK